MINKKDNSVMTSTVENFFTVDDVFDYEQGLHFAMAFTAYDNTSEDILDPSYGSIIYSSY